MAAVTNQKNEGLGLIQRRAMLTTCSGGDMDLLVPDYTNVTASDIAHGLAGEIRYNAQSPKRETVAEHTVLLSKWCRQRRGRITDSAFDSTLTGSILGSLWGSNRPDGPDWHPVVKPLIVEYGEPVWIEVAAGTLFHDAPEALLGDTVSPLKKLDDMEWFRALEMDHMERVIMRFGLPALESPVWKFVEALDHEIVIDEIRALWPDTPPACTKKWGPTRGLGVKVESWSMERAELEWLTEYELVMRELSRSRADRGL